MLPPLIPAPQALHGDGLLVALAVGAALTLQGAGDVVLTSPGDVLTILPPSSVAVRGGGAKITLAGQDTLSLSGTGYQVSANGAGDTIALQSGAQADLYGAGVALLGADVSVALFGAFEVFAPERAGLSTITAFGLGDTLHLQSAYSDIAALLDAATQESGAATLSVDGAGGVLRLAGLDKAQVSAFAASGQIRLD